MVRSKVILILCLSTVLIAAMPANVFGASTSQLSSVGISVSPAIEQITLKANQQTASFVTKFTNNTSNDLLVKVSPRDFTASSDGTRLAFVSNGSSIAHGLSQSIQVTNKPFVVTSHNAVKVNAFITDAQNLAPGGHYASLIFSAQGIKSDEQKTVTVREAVSSLIFLNTFGGGTQSIQVAALPFGGFRTHLPNNVQIVLSDMGNTPTIPRGYVQLVGPSGKVYAQTTINTDSSMILPGSKRLFPVSFEQINKQPLYGAFHLKVFYRNDGQNYYSVYDKKFWLISYWMILFIVLLVILITGLTFWRFKPKKKSKIVQKAPVRKYIDIVKK